MEKLDVLGLAKALEASGLDAETSKKLQSEKINGATFMKLTASLLRVCEFSGQEIMTILDLQSKGQDLLIGIPSPLASPSKTRRGSDGDVTYDDIYDGPDMAEIDEALSGYLSDLESFEEFERNNMHTKLKRYEDALESDPSAASKVKPWFVKAAEKRQEKERNAKQDESSEGSTKGRSKSVTDNSSVKAGERRKDGVSDGETRGSCGRSENSQMQDSRKRKSDESTKNSEAKSSRQASSSGASQSSATKSADNSTEKSWLDDDEDDFVENEEDKDSADFIKPEDIDEAVKAFVVEIPASMSALKNDLPDFDVLKILSTEVKNLKQQVKRCFLNLLKNQWVMQQERKTIMRVLTRYLHLKHVKNVSDVTGRMKEGMAKSFVCHFPKFASNDENSMPWCHVYNSQGPKGWIQNCSRGLAKEHPRRKKKSKSVNPITDYTSEEEIEYLALLNTTNAEKPEVLKLMAKTFPKRQEERQKGESITYFTEKYIQLLNFDGQVLNEEFSRLQPNAKDMCREFIRLRLKILDLPPHREINLDFDHGVLKCLLLLSQHLPHDIPHKQQDKWANFTWAREEDIVVTTKVGESIDNILFERREEAVKLKRQVQPYLIFVKSEHVKNKVYKMFLALDSKPMMLPSTEPLKGLDFLFKAMFVFNVRYPFGWRNTFHFLQTSFYGIFEKSNQIDPSKARWKDTVTSSEFELMKILNQ